MLVAVKRVRYIHTLGCSSSPMPCGLMVKQFCEVGTVLSGLKTLLNNPDEALTHHSVEEHFIIVFKPCYGEEVSASSP